VVLDQLAPYGWNDRWAALLAQHWPDATPGRVVRNDGSALIVALPDGIEVATYEPNSALQPVVGDWVAVVAGHVEGILPRDGLLRRRSARSEAEQQLAANVDVVLLVCGVDRPVKTGRIQRGATLAWDAGAVPKVVLTKAALNEDLDQIVAEVTGANPSLDVIITSVREGRGLDELREVIRDQTVVMLGESGAGKSSIVNALLGDDTAATGAVRKGDAKGRHTTTSRHLHVFPGGGALIDTPGIRQVGVWVDPEAVNAAFPEIGELADGCRFRDCSHDGEPGCAVEAAVAAGSLAADRLDAWRMLIAEAQGAALTDTPYELRRQNRKASKANKQTSRRKRR
jgi:ribosome biogenesis GTPase